MKVVHSIQRHIWTYGGSLLLSLCLLFSITADTALASHHLPQEDMQQEERTETGKDEQINRGVEQEKEHVQQEWQRLNELAEESLALIERKEYPEARDRVQDVADFYMDLDASRHLAEVEQAHILLETIVQAKQALTAAQIDEQEVQKKVLKMRLAIHAVSHDERPLWLEYYSVFEKIIVELQHTLNEGERDSFFQHLNRLAVHYELVRPSIVVSHRPQVYNQLDSQMAYFFNQRAELWQNQDRTEEMLQSLHQQLRVAFLLEEGKQQSFWLVLIGLGTFICVILGYAGWRKYQGEQRRRAIPWREFDSR